MLIRRMLAIVVLASFPLVGFASLLSTSPAPQQSFRSASTSSNSASATAAQEMAKVKAIMAKARAEQKSASKQKVTTNESHQVPGNQRSMLIPKATTHSRSISATGGQSLSQQVAELSKANKLMQQQVQDRVQMLTMKNNQLQDSLQRMDKALLLLNQEVNQLNGKLTAVHAQMALIKQQPQPHSQSSTMKSLWVKVQQNLGPVLMVVSLAVIVVLLLIVVLLFARRKKTSSKASKSKQTAQGEQDSDTKAEYDFMATKEAIPAKLDLARAYITMEDFKAAKEVLQEIVKHGDEQQQQEAHTLLKDLPATS